MEESISSEEIGIEGRRHGETIVERDYRFLRWTGISLSLSLSLLWLENIELECLFDSG